MDTSRTTQPQGRPPAELRRLVAADARRFATLGRLWNDLTPVEQDDLIATAWEMRRTGRARRRSLNPLTKLAPGELDPRD